MPRKFVYEAQGKDVSPGELYKGITYSKEFGERGETRLVRKVDPGYVRFCKSCHKSFPSLGKGAKFSQKYKEAIDFLGWNLSAEELAAAFKLTLLAAIIFGFILIVVALMSPLPSYVASFTGMQELAIAYIFIPIILMVYAIVNFMQKYALNVAKTEQVKALTYVPEIMGYMIMSMKLVPNLEKSVEFAAEHGRGKIAEDFKKIIWDVQLGIFNTLSEALDDMAYKWGKFSEEFKTSLMMIRASVLEDTEAKRYQLLDKTMDNTLESIRNKMEQYARELSQPTVMLFYLGVLLPLTLIIILPVGSAFSGQALARPEIIILIYNIIIPAAAFIFARNVLKSRPPTYEPPIIPEGSPLVPPKWKMKLGNSFLDVRAVLFLVLLLGAGTSFFLHLNGIVIQKNAGTGFWGPVISYDCKTVNIKSEGIMVFLALDKTEECVYLEAGKENNYYGENGVLYQQLINSGESSEKASARVALERTQFFSEPKNDVTPYNLIFGSLITFSLLCFVFLYYSNIYKRKVQLDAIQMESEFKDSLYVLASRLGENKPVEEALRHAKEFLPSYKISNTLFGRTIDNINMLGMPLELAVFDPNYGSLKNNPSAIIRSSMRLLVDSVQLGAEVSARTLISLSLQLNNSEKVSKMLSILVQEITSTMKTMAVFVAPIVLGITTALQKIVIMTLGSIISQGTFERFSEMPSVTSPGVTASGVGNFTAGLSSLKFTAESFAQLVTPAQFTLIVAVYIIEIVIILTYYTTKIEEDNWLLAKINIGKALPIATVIFVVSIIVANSVVGTFTG
ncbi:MAG: type II secretion system F family protein [Candidatus Diapherotrites archaeon]